MLDPMAAYVAQAWSFQGQFPLLILIAALLGLGKGGVPGLATVATAATVATSPTHIPGGLGLAVALQVPILTMIDISAAWLHFQDLDVDTIKVLLPCSFLGMALGQFLDRHLSDSQARFLVGLLLLMILSVQLGKDYMMIPRVQQQGRSNNTILKVSSKDQEEEKHDDDDSLIRAESGIYEEQQQLRDNKPTLNHRRTSTTATTNSGSAQEQPPLTLGETKIHTSSKNNKKGTILSPKTQWIWAMVVGIIGGAATMLTNAMGPILNVYLLSVVQLSPSAYIGTRAMFFCFLNCGKLPMRFLAGTLGWSMIPLAGVLGLVSVVGVMCAKPIMLSMSETNFVKLELAVVAFSGCRLCWMGWFGAAAA